MFFIFSKEKMASYVVAISTVAVLFTMSIMVNKEDTIETSVNDTKDIKIHNIQRDENNMGINNTKNSLQ